MKKKEAKEKIEGLRYKFELEFASNVMGELSVRNAWIEEAMRLTMDAFGIYDELYGIIIEIRDLSDKFENTQDDAQKYLVSSEWHAKAGIWLNKMDSNIDYSTKFDKTGFQNTKWFALIYPLVLAFIAASINYFYSNHLSDAQQKFVREQVENENKRECTEFCVSGRFMCFRSFPRRRCRSD